MRERRKTTDIYVYMSTIAKAGSMHREILHWPSASVGCVGGEELCRKVNFPKWTDTDTVVQFPSTSLTTRRFRTEFGAPPSLVFIGSTCRKNGYVPPQGGRL